MADHKAADQAGVAEKIAQLDAEHAVPPNPDAANPANQGSGIPAAQGMHGMFDGKSPHAANHADADATAVEAETGKQPPPGE